MPNNTPQGVHQAQQGPGRYARALAALKPVLGLALGLSAVVNLLMLTGSIYMLQVYDRVLASGSVPTLIGLFTIVVMLYGFLGVFDTLRGRLFSRGAYRLDAALGRAAFEGHVASGLPGGTALEGGGAGKAQALRDLDALRGFLAGPSPAALADLPFVPVFLGVLFIIHPLLGLLTIAGAGIGGLIAWANKRRTGAALERAAQLDLIERDFAERGRRGAETIAAMGMGGAVADRWQVLHGAALATAQAAGEPMAAATATSRSFRMLLQSAILTLGAWLVIGGQISGGMIIASSVLSGRALGPIDQIVGQWSLIAKAGAARRRLAAHFAAEAPAPERIALPDFKGAVTVTGLTRLASARPGEAEPAKILDAVSFALAPGEVLGVIGASASGKSTLARLLVGALTADAGEIRLDGATADQWEPARLGRRIGYLPQFVEMLPGTIGQNIARFDPACADETVIAAARLTGIHQMILGLPQGYATRLAEPGAPPLLSGGQLQRLGLARAVCGLPALVVLDEPNSNLDRAGDLALAETIHALQDAGSTVVVMTHRPSALETVGKLMLLEAGRVRAFGDRATLMPDNPAPAPAVAAQAPAAAAAVTRLGRAKRLPAAVRNAGPAHRRATA